MDPHPASLQPARPVLHALPPVMPLRNAADVSFRVDNLRASMNACPTCWRHYYEVMANVIEREVN